MKSKALLIQPPYGRACEIPWGSLPALTGALRANGYKVDLRDLNAQMFPALFGTTALAEIRTRILQKLEGVRRPGAENVHLERSLERLRERLGEIEAAVANASASYARESPTGTYTAETHAAIENLYPLFVKALDVLAAPSTDSDDYFSRVENAEENLYYRLFEPAMASWPWEEVALVGISMSTGSMLAGLTLANMVRNTHPDVPLILGGPLFVTIDFQDSLDLADLKTLVTRYAHGVVVYEGESAIVRIMECLRDGLPWSSVPNLVWVADGELQINRPFVFEKKENIQRPDFDGLPVSIYPGLPVEVSRGCYWSRCSFCGRCYQHYQRHTFVHDVPSYRFFGVDRIVSTIRDLQEKYGKDFFEFACLDISPTEMRNLCGGIRDAGLKIRWGARLRLDRTFTPDLFELMASAGASFYHFHPETFCQKTSDLHNKNYSVRHIKDLLRYWEEHQSHLPRLTVNIFTGFPGESLWQFRKTFRFIRKGTFNVRRIGRFVLAKHSGVYYDPSKYGVTILREKNKDGLFHNFRLLWSRKRARQRDRIERFIAKHADELRVVCNEWDNKWDILYGGPK